tara:strand:+ start:108 stop:1034 length:927 start_codon:yes stop_codon:yes gene_type:complete
MKKVPKKFQEFYCKCCNYTTSRYSQYSRHLLTAKHKILTNPNEKSSAGFQQFTCECGKSYKHYSSLCAHRKKCNFIDNYDDETIHGPIVERSPNENELIMELIKQNQDFKSLLVEQQKENQSLQKQLLEAVKDGSQTINNTTNNNQKFNLNFFLNTTCKDAMNMSEFIENISTEFKDIENIGKNGYVNGMTDMILSRIRDLDVTKRPLHCVDLKRETMYIKDNDEWSKDTPDNQRLKNMITIVAQQNYGIVPLWREKYPECQDWNNPKYDFCISMMRNILGDIEEKQIRMDNKIIKNLSRHILVEKNL